MKIIEITQHILPNTEEGRKLADELEQSFRRTEIYRSKYITSHQITIESKFEYNVENSGGTSGNES